MQVIVSQQHTEKGYVKYQSNIEKHRAFIGTHRVDIDMSAKYAAMEDQFINIATKDKEFTYKLTGAEKVCMDSFMAVKNGKALFSKGSVDVNGKSTLVDDIGRPKVLNFNKLRLGLAAVMLC